MKNNLLILTISSFPFFTFFFLLLSFFISFRKPQKELHIYLSLSSPLSTTFTLHSSLFNLHLFVLSYIAYRSSHNHSLYSPPLYCFALLESNNPHHTLHHGKHLSSGSEIILKTPRLTIYSHKQDSSSTVISNTENVRLPPPLLTPSIEPHILIRSRYSS